MIKQEAILLTKDNVSAVAATLDCYSAEELLADNEHLLNLSGNIVLCSVPYSDGLRFVEYVVHESLYRVNNDNFDALNDKTYTPVNPI